MDHKLTKVNTKNKSGYVLLGVTSNFRIFLASVLLLTSVSLSAMFLKYNLQWNENKKKSYFNFMI